MKKSKKNKIYIKADQFDFNGNLRGKNNNFSNYKHTILPPGSCKGSETTWDQVGDPKLKGNKSCWN